MRDLDTGLRSLLSGDGFGVVVLPPTESVQRRLRDLSLMTLSSQTDVESRWDAVTGWFLTIHIPPHDDFISKVKVSFKPLK